MVEKNISSTTWFAAAFVLMIITFLIFPEEFSLSEIGGIFAFVLFLFGAIYVISLYKKKK